MELSSQDSIRAVVTALGISVDRQRPGPRRITRRATNASSIGAGPENRKVLREPVKDRRVKCACGTCNRCLDNARWERIFAEKFADPDYYAPRSTPFVSPLASF